MDDPYDTIIDTALVVDTASGVLANEPAGEGGPLTVVTPGVIPTTGGSVTLNADGSFTYTPNPGFFGDDTFTYEATNGPQTTTPPPSRSPLPPCPLPPTTRTPPPRTRLSLSVPTMPSNWPGAPAETKTANLRTRTVWRTLGSQRHLTTISGHTGPLERSANEKGTTHLAPLCAMKYQPAPARSYLPREDNAPRDNQWSVPRDGDAVWRPLDPAVEPGRHGVNLPQRHHVDLPRSCLTLSIPRADGAAYGVENPGFADLR